MSTLVTGGNIRTPASNNTPNLIAVPRPKLGQALTILGVLTAIATCIGVYLVAHNSVHATITDTSFAVTTTTWILILPLTISLLASTLAILGGIALRNPTPGYRSPKFLVGGTIIAACMIFMVGLLPAAGGNPNYEQWGAAHNISNLNFPTGNVNHTIIKTTVINDQNKPVTVTWRILDGDNYTITLNK